MSFNRTLNELRTKASLHWTKELTIEASKQTLLFDLLNTHDEFISVLKLSSKKPLSWQKILEESENLSLPLFAKHLMILCDLGGETLNKILPISDYFPENALTFKWKNSYETYNFKEIHTVKSLTNSSLKLTMKSIYTNNRISLLTDLIMILLYGSQAKNDLLPSEYKLKTIVGTMIGDAKRIDKFLKENYIRISTQIKGAHSNALGHFAQDYVYRKLSEFLPREWTLIKEHSLSGVKHTNSGSETNFDIIAISPTGNQFGIEVSFQVTTNSVIERKARDSAALKERAHNLGHYICYVIDGAGNINVRKKAVETICSHSDCTVALTHEEINVLGQFLLSKG